MSRILLTGSTGQVGHELRHSLSVLGEVIAPLRAALDLASPDAIRRVVRETNPTLIVNPAAYTAVDKAESEPELAAALNATAPAVLAEEAARLGIPLVHFSTDYVFAGQATAPYRETDATAPQSVYGRTKLAGEAAIIATGCPHLIFRTSWVYGAHGNNFVKTILRLAQTRDTLSVVSDQLGAPTSARLLADTTLAVVSQLQYQRHGWLERSGIYHLTPRGQTHWHAFACAIVRAAQAQGMSLMLTPEQIRAIPTTDYPTPAQRPAYSCLDSYKLTETFGLSLPDWADDFALNFAAVRAGCV